MVGILNVKHDIAKITSDNQLVIFIKGEPTVTSCGFSSRAIQILNHYGVDYVSENVLRSDDLRYGVKAFSGVKTLPQIFINGVYFGGSDDLRELHETGALESVFQSKNIILNLHDATPTLVIADVTKDEIKSCGTATAPRQLQA